MLEHFKCLEQAVDNDRSQFTNMIRTQLYLL